VKFYDSEDALFSLVGDFLAEGASAGHPLIVIARANRHARFATALQERGVDCDASFASGRLQLFDARDVMATFMSDSMPDETRFFNSVGRIMTTTAATHGAARAYGEMVDLLWNDGNPEAAVRLEELWNTLLQRTSFRLFCAYAIGNFYKETDRELFDLVCQNHTQVLPAGIESLHDADQSRLIARLQQRTLALETEIRHRRELEAALRESLAARRDHEAELRRLYELAQEANRTKDQFLATLSHELRTPLTAILGWARMLTLGGLDESTVRTALETIELSARTQATIVDDLLDLSKIVTGKLALQSEMVDLGSAVDEAVRTCVLAAEAKGVRVNVVRPEEPILVAGDPTRLRQIIWNLLSNAIKYSDEGAEVSIEVERAPDDVMITVRDHGHGIVPEFLPHIFEPFRQADASLTRGHGGLGLGLTIVKHITELHGGCVEVVSEGRGHGATFTVTLPTA